MSTEARIREFIHDTFLADDFGDDDSFLKTGLIDSTGMLELVAFIEEAFAIEVQDSELLPANLDSVRNLARFVERKTQRAAE